MNDTSYHPLVKQLKEVKEQFFDFSYLLCSGDEIHRDAAMQMPEIIDCINEISRDLIRCKKRIKKAMNDGLEVVGYQLRERPTTVFVTDLDKVLNHVGISMEDMLKHHRFERRHVARVLAKIKDIPVGTASYQMREIDDACFELAGSQKCIVPTNPIP